MRRDDNLVFDVGMHVGQDAEFYLKKGFRVIAVEANPTLVQSATVRFRREIQQGRLVILNVGIADHEAILPFYVNHHLSEWSSFLRDVGGRMGRFHTVDVRCVNMSAVFARFGVPYYLKVDIEGFDHLAIDALHEVAAKPKYVSVENGNNGLCESLAAVGYDTFKFINQATVADVKLTKPPREGRFVAHTFPRGSSGPFGEETPGPWVDYDHVRKQIQEYWETPGLDASIHGWYDLHARLGN